jgi:hypothetical protein
MPMTPHIEKHFTATETVRDVVIGMALEETWRVLGAKAVGVDWLVEGDRKDGCMTECGIHPEAEHAPSKFTTHTRPVCCPDRLAWKRTRDLLISKEKWRARRDSNS